MEEAAVMMTGVNRERVTQAIDILIKSKKGKDRELDMVIDYKCKNISEKVLRIILSYTDYIQRKTWKKFLN